ncbi:hypothetical protein GCM10011317_29410 [Niveispirillum cyanobacteriorum]|nr:hypothetical protein GCM10011317_29410 [Niveispirillum cyanobacteriorum]
MPIPSVDPSPPLADESRRWVPLDAQDASYFAASDKTARRCFRDLAMIRTGRGGSFVHDMFVVAHVNSHELCSPS